MTIDSIRVALRGMLANRMRSLLTMLGILIGTAAVILLVAVGTGISNLVQHQIETLGSNAVYIFPQQSRGGQDRGGTNARRIRLTQDRRRRPLRPAEGAEHHQRGPDDADQRHRRRRRARPTPCRT